MRLLFIYIKDFGILKDIDIDEFYIRAGASSPSLPASHTHEYIKQHFS
jgi:hypothetical protein